jgi:hypothetical protein
LGGDVMTIGEYEPFAYIVMAKTKEKISQNRPFVKE